VRAAAVRLRQDQGVNPMLITIVLTVLAAVVVVLTRVRLANDDGGAGRISIPHGLLNTHTFAGVPALLLWAGYLYTAWGDGSGSALLGWGALLLWWVTVVAGLLVLARWLPAKGRHAEGQQADTWGEGPGLSILAHVGLLVGVVIFTAFVATGSL
jgi:preprotein translocase subunit SecY